VRIEGERRAGQGEGPSIGETAFAEQHHHARAGGEQQERVVQSEGRSEGEEEHEQDERIERSGRLQAGKRDAAEPPGVPERNAAALPLVEGGQSVGKVDEKRISAMPCAGIGLFGVVPGRVIVDAVGLGGDPAQEERRGERADADQRDDDEGNSNRPTPVDPLRVVLFRS